jgi:hypothetical protein
MKEINENKGHKEADTIQANEKELLVQQSANPRREERNKN